MRGWRRGGHTELRRLPGEANWEAETSQVHLPDEVGEEGRRAEGRKRDCRERKEVDWGPEVKGRSTWVVLAAASLFPAPVLSEALGILETAWDYVLV